MYPSNECHHFKYITKISTFAVLCRTKFFVIATAKLGIGRMEIKFYLFKVRVPVAVHVPVPIIYICGYGFTITWSEHVLVLKQVLGLLPYE